MIIYGNKQIIIGVLIQMNLEFWINFKKISL